MNKKIVLSGLAAAILLFSGAVSADGQEKVQPRDQTQVQQQTTGSQMMTADERKEQRAKMRSATTKAEREKIRAEHHEIMKGRAKEQGRAIPDNPPAGGMGGGMGAGRR